MNDEFLHRLRQPPPAAFTARLRARLEAQALARRFRRRHVTLYSLIACLLGSTALALVVPGVRASARAMIREMLPEWPRQAASAPVPRSSVDPRQRERPGFEPERDTQRQYASNPATRTAGAVRSESAVHIRLAPDAPPTATLAVVPRTQPMTEARPVTQVRLVGARHVAAALQGLITEFQSEQRDVRVVTESTTNTKAFKLFCMGATDIAMVTRMMTSTEFEACKRIGPEQTVLPIAHDALAVLTNSANEWAPALSAADLKTLFDPSAAPAMFSWSQLNPQWPGLAVAVFAPRPGVGFAETFSELVFDMTPAEQATPAAELASEPSRLLQRLQRTPQALTYVPYALYLDSQQRDAFKALEIVNADGIAVAPSRASIADGSYELARPLLLFLRRRADRIDAAEDFVAHVLTRGEQGLARSGYLPLQRGEMQLAKSILRNWNLPPFEPTQLKRLTAREVLLQQVPADKRERERARLESN